MIVLTRQGQPSPIGSRASTSGATDYVTKPFSFEELAARVRAHLRQPRPARSRTTLRPAESSSTCSRAAPSVTAISVRLSEREAELLAHLMRHAGQVCTHREILSAVWGYDHDPGTNVVQVYIGYLRRRLALPGSPAPIETVRSVGYRLPAAVKEVWKQIGLRGKMAISIGIIVLIALGLVVLGVRREVERRSAASCSAVRSALSPSSSPVDRSTKPSPGSASSSPTPRTSCVRH